MLYSKQELSSLSDVKREEATSRYLHKCVKKETRKFLPHECEHLTSLLPSITTDPDVFVPAFNIYELDYLSEALFKKLILTYLDNLDFLSPVYNGVKNLNTKEIERDKTAFQKLVKAWEDRLKTGQKDPYLHEVRLEYCRKLKILEKQYKDHLYGYLLYKRKVLEQKTSSFYVYFTVKSFFKNFKSDYVLFNAFGKTFSVNIYSYVHILSRHYMPKMNGIDHERSFNREISFINPFYLPEGIQVLISKYQSHARNGFQLNCEYMIFKEGSHHYILWWKVKKLAELKFKLGYEVRSFYRVYLQRDIDKIKDKEAVVIDSELIFYY